MVTSKKTGFPGVGKIVGAIPYLVQCQQEQHGPAQYWINLYPECMHKYLYFIYFETPRPVRTLDEMLFGSGLERSTMNPDMLQWYTTQAALQPQYHLVQYPEDDLEKWE